MLIFYRNSNNNNVSVRDDAGSCFELLGNGQVELKAYSHEYFKEFVRDLSDKSFENFRTILCSWAKINYFRKNPEFYNFLRESLAA